MTKLCFLKRKRDSRGRERVWREGRTSCQTLVMRRKWIYISRFVVVVDFFFLMIVAFHWNIRTAPLVLTDSFVKQHSQQSERIKAHQQP